VDLTGEFVGDENAPLSINCKARDAAHWRCVDLAHGTLFDTHEGAHLTGCAPERTGNAREA
jgi:hypothetical protein